METLLPWQQANWAVTLFYESILTLFGLGCCQPKETGRGRGKVPPPNLAVSNQMTIKLGNSILWVEIFTN